MALSASGSRSSLAPFLLSSVAVIGAVVAVGAMVTGKGSTKSTEPQSAAALAPDDLVPDEIVVDFKDGTTKALYDQLEKQWGVDVEFNSIEGVEDGITIGHVDPAKREALLALIRKDPNVERAEPLFHYHADLVPNDPQFKAQWNFEMISMRDAWEVTQGEGVTVAVIDTGIAYEDRGEFKAVPDLRGARFAKGYDFVNKDDHPNDDHGHGTHVAGTIAQVTNNGEGVAGIAFKATLMPLKVLDANGSGTSADIADAIRFAADHGARVLNLSLGGGGRSEVMAAAVAYARKKGAVVVCAAGNGRRGVVEYPAAYPGAVAVSAVGPSGELASYSSWGKEVDIAAPGGDKKLREQDGVLQNTIAPGHPGESIYAYFQGTSMATPHVAGVAALLFAAGARSPDEVERALFAGADHRKSGEWSDRLGHGVLNAKGALEALGAGPVKKPFWQRALLFLWALVLWLLTRMTLPSPVRRAIKPGLGFLLSALISVLGFFFLPWIGLGGMPGASVLSQPVPEWGGALFGAAASPLFYSALIPFVLALLFFRNERLRGVLAGFAIGFATCLLVKAFSGAPAVAFLGWLSIPWLVVSALLALIIARAAMRSEAR